MNKQFAKYMNYGKKVVSSYTGEEYMLIENMNPASETVRAIAADTRRRFDMLHAWIRNWEQDSYGFRERIIKDRQQCGTIEDWKKELQGLEVELRIDSITPCDKVRFITSNYKTLFEVPNLTNVVVNGEVRRVIYLDEYHFQFERGSCLHICEYAELRERNGVTVAPV